MSPWPNRTRSRAGRRPEMSPWPNRTAIRDPRTREMFAQGDAARSRAGGTREMFAQGDAARSRQRDEAGYRRQTRPVGRGGFAFGRPPTDGLVDCPRSG